MSQQSAWRSMNCAIRSGPAQVGPATKIEQLLQGVLVSGLNMFTYEATTELLYAEQSVRPEVRGIKHQGW